ncbi:DMT family transporter [Hartmannibacter diazotrophicus]|uniref:DMT family transporter n=1 Tax=Hartmannibacter diazotrophicus TaxID=1482074 RepID=UPI0013905642|nr:DMT family transporter [Hartmannibacter diazotrophicus]
MAEAATAPVPTVSAIGAAGLAVATRRRFGTGLAAAGRRGRSRWHAVPDNLRGSALMVGSIVFFCVMMAGIKDIGTGLPLVEILLIRQVFSTLVILPFFRHDLASAFRTNNARMLLLRGLFTLGSQYTYFLAVIYLPLAEMTALGFSQVIFMTIGAVLILKERVGRRRWIATAIGFVGVAIMLKPGAEVLNPYALLAIVSAVLLCGVTLSIRLLAATETTTTLLLYQSIVLCSAYLGPTIWWWEWPSAQEWTMLVVVGVFGTICQYLFTMAFRVGEASAIAPLEFTRLIMAGLIGFLYFGEIPDAWTLIGATIVVGSTIDTVRRNAGRG